MSIQLEKFPPSQEDIYNMDTSSLCDYKIVKFLNSLGGYQFYVFEKYEIKTKNKPGKTIARTTNRLRQNNFLNIENSTERTIKFFTKTPAEVQEVITDLISSLEVFLYYPDGEDDEAKWERLVLESNSTVENNTDDVYNNELEFSFANYYTNSL